MCSCCCYLCPVRLEPFRCRDDCGRGAPSPTAGSGGGRYSLDEMERALHDAMSVIKRVLESNDIVPGGGAVEAALSIHLENFATTLSSREQVLPRPGGRRCPCLAPHRVTVPRHRIWREETGHPCFKETDGRPGGRAAPQLGRRPPPHPPTHPPT